MFLSQVEGGCKLEKGCPPNSQGTGAPASVHHCDRTQQVRDLFFPLIQGDCFFVLCISSQARRHLRALAEQLLQVTKAKAEWEHSKEKGF